jgi:hypothetical protein
MPELTFKTDDEWRIAIAPQVIKLELAVYEVGIALMLVAAGAFVGSHWWREAAQDHDAPVTPQAQRPYGGAAS